MRLQLHVQVPGRFICLLTASSWTCAHVQALLLPRQCYQMAVSSSTHLGAGDCLALLPQPCIET